MHSPDILKLLQQVLAPPVPASPPPLDEEKYSPRRATTQALDSDDETELRVQRATVDEDLLKQLRFFFSDPLILAAFDIVDRDGGGWLFSPA